MSSKSAKHIAAKVVALLTSDYTSRITIVSVREVDYGQEVVLQDEAHDEEFVVTVQKRTNGPAIVASTADGRVVVDEDRGGYVIPDPEDDDKEEEPF